MNAAEKNVSKYIGGLLPADASHADSLKKITEQYPYFASAQYLLAKELYKSNHDDAGEQSQKTALFFTNPFWLQYLLGNEENEEPLFTSRVIETGIDSNEDSPAAESITEAEEPVIIHEVSAVEETYNDEISNSKEVSASQEITEHTNNFPAENISEEEYAAQEAIADDTEPGENAFEGASFENEKMSSMLQQHAAALHTPADANAELEIPITPYHTVDYFASQGIKLEALLKGNDQLTSKVKRFTDWLKDMKRISPVPQDLGTDAQTEHLVEEIAAHSNEAKEILTEAMAEVLLKQGKAQKAVELYEKLSFLNPSKSTYFAAKIEQIKGS